MAKKYKVTGCARLFIILIILAPLTYIGASYINGEDGIDNFKRLIRFEQIFGGNEDSEEDSNDQDTREVKVLKDKIKRLEEANKELQEQVDYLEEKLDRINNQQQE